MDRICIGDYGVMSMGKLIDYYLYDFIYLINYVFNIFGVYFYNIVQTLAVKTNSRA